MKHKKGFAAVLLTLIISALSVSAFAGTDVNFCSVSKHSAASSLQLSIKRIIF